MGSSERRGSLQVERGTRRLWTAEEDELLVQLRESRMSWLEISKRLPGRSSVACPNRYESVKDRWEVGEEAKNELARLYVR